MTNEFKTKCENLEQYLNSNYFYDSLMGLKNIFEENADWINIDFLDRIFGAAISYHLLFDNSKDDFINNLNYIIEKEIEVFQNLDIYDLYYGYGNPGDIKTDNIEKLFLEKIQRDDINIEKLFEKYMFHAFNPCFLESIKEKGLNPNAKQSMVREMDEIDRICDENGISSLFICYGDNNYGVVNYSLTPFVSYQYSQKSPEVFYHFTGDGKGYRGQVESSSYIVKDYEKCKSNVEFIVEEYNFDDKDKTKLLNFFEKYWEKYNYDYGMLAIIPCDSDLSDKDINNINIQETVRKYLYSKPNEESYEKIDTKNANFIKMPGLNTLYKKLGVNKDKSVSK